MTSWTLQVLVALALLPLAVGKFTGDSQTTATFTQLGMEPAGRYLIGVLELIAVGLLLIPGIATWGAILTWGVMTGALIAHATILGLGEPVPFLGLPLSILALINWLGASAIVVLRRHDIGFIRDMSPEADLTPRKP